MDLPLHSFDQVLKDLETKTRHAAETPDIPSDVRRALHAALANIWAAEAEWEDLQEKMSRSAFFDPEYRKD